MRPIVRGKSKAKIEFGAKIHLSLVDGYSFLDTVSWDALNEGSYMMEYVEKYHERFGHKPLGRPLAKTVGKQVSPGERNPIEGKFGQAKTEYGMNRIRARLKSTSQSWIVSIILVLNLVKLAREASLWLSFSAWKVLNAC